MRKSSFLFHLTLTFLVCGASVPAQGFSQMMRLNPSVPGMPDMKSMGNGVMLRMETTSIESGAITKMEAKLISKEGKTSKISEYKVMAMPGH